jgi:glucokinase
MVVAIDLGGTNIRVARLDQGQIVAQKEAALQDKDQLQKTLDQLMDLIAAVMDETVTGIGIGVPSVVDVETGTVYDVVNIPSWKKVELGRILEDRFSVPVRVNNDVNCFILGEHRFGSARSYRSVVGLSMGTGLGGGIIIDGQLYAGRNCGAGEFGMLPYLDDTLETYCSGGFFQKKSNITALEAFQLAEKGDAVAIKLWSEFGMHVGTAIKTVVYTYDPEAVVLGGSLSKAFPYFEQSMRRSMMDFGFPESMRNLKIHLSELKDVPLLGAASLIP